MSEWKEYKLPDFVEIHNRRRIPLSKTERQKRRGVFPYYGASGIIDHIDDYLFDGEFVLISEDGENLRSRQTPVAFKAVGKFWVNNHAHILEGKKKFHNDLIAYYFNRLDLTPYITGAAQPKLNKANLLAIPIFLPADENEQKAIVSVLSSLDDKIALLRRQNKTLEAMAEILYRQYFTVDAAADRPRRPLAEVTGVAIGRTPPRKEPSWFSKRETDVKWMSIKDLGQNGVFVFDTCERLTREAIERFNIPVIPADTVVLSFKMTVGRVAITGEPMVSNEAIACFKLDKDAGFSKEYLYFFLKRFKYDTLGSTSSIVTAINSALVKEIKIVVPGKSAMARFRADSEPQFNKIKANRRQIRTLERLRDTLLSNLMSGRVRVAY